MRQQQCIVIGAGIAGLSTAALLAKKGYDVTVVEQANTYGGKMGELRVGDAVFAAGPTLCTEPHVIDAIFTECGKNPRDYWQYDKQTEVARYFWPSDGSRYVMPEGAIRIERSLVQSFNESPKRTRKYVERTVRMYEQAAPYFIDTNLHAATLLRPKALIIVFRLLPMLFRTLNTRNHAYFSNKKTVQLFNRYATYSGSNPYKTPAVTGLAGVPELLQGAYVPQGGMRSIATGLFELCKDMGVTFCFNEKVTALMQHNQTVTSVKTSRQTHPCDVVVYGGDAVRLYELLGDAVAKQKARMPERSSSAMVFYWEVRGVYKNFGLHNVIFSDDYKAEFDQLQRGEMPSDPTIYLAITSKVLPGQATKGTENWFVMVNVPAGTKDVVVLSAKEAIRNKLEAMLGGYITILNEDYMSPSKLDAQTGAWQGAIYGQATNSLLALLRRPKNHGKTPKNVYCVGGTVHPGGGIPLAVRSGKIVADKL